jgi:2',3'-cyclic-nucleotide 2'-phosphodiesterase (5'-nucleotidase family)
LECFVLQFILILNAKTKKNKDSLKRKNFIILFFRLSFLLLACCAQLSCRNHTFLVKADASVIKFDSTHAIAEDTATLNFIRPYKLKMEALMNDTLAFSEQALTKGSPEGLLNNFIADLLFKTGQEIYKYSSSEKIDICLLNSGGLRSSLPQGAITRGKVFELMPFENYISVVKISGAKTKLLIHFLAKSGGMPESGIIMGIKDTNAVNVKINGLPFDSTQSYMVITSDYLANGGNDMDFFLNPVSRLDLDLKVRDAIIEYLQKEKKNGRKINAVLDKRIYYEK